jgi:uncharacterized membrane protein
MTMAGLFALSPRPSARVVTVADAGPVTFADARRVIDRRCTSCHSMTPIASFATAAPLGVIFDTPEEIARHANRIHERAVVSRTMPPANWTSMTDTERDILRRWFAAGAVIR